VSKHKTQNNHHHDCKHTKIKEKSPPLSTSPSSHGSDRGATAAANVEARVGVRTSTKQSMDYITVKGISQRTNYPPNRLIEFVVKELVDNAVDFLYDNSSGGASNYNDAASVWLNLKQETIEIYQQSLKVLRITVRNSNEFGLIPFQDVPAVFDMNTFDSTKRHQHRISGGALGDALKEILAIPYALISSTDDGSSFERKQWELPLVLGFCGLEYRVYLHVDKTDDIEPIRSRVDGPYQLPKERLSSHHHHNDHNHHIIEVQVTIPLVNSVLGDCSDLVQRLQRLYDMYKLCNGKRIHFHFSNDDDDNNALEEKYKQ
jgi:hypothetical protein